MAKPSLFKEFFLFIRHEKKWWLIPLMAVLLVVSTILVLASAYPAAAPFFYPLF